MTLTLVLMTFILMIRLGLPSQQSSWPRLLCISSLIVLAVLVCLEFNPGGAILMVLLVATQVIAERFFPESWRYPVRVLSLIDALLIIVILHFMPWVNIVPQPWLDNMPSLGLKYIALTMGALLLARETLWLQTALVKPRNTATQPYDHSGILERGLMYAGLVLGLTYWWVLGVIVAKGFILKTSAGAAWVSSAGSALLTLVVFDLIHRGFAG